MASLRNTPLDGYLDAARECILDVGWRRTTLTEVARRSGVSRMTIYRAWPDMATLLGDLMTREWVGVADTAREAAADTRSPEGIAAGCVAMVRALRDNDLFVRIVELDPELLLPYLLSRRGRSQELLVRILSSEIEAGQESGLLRAGDPGALARTIVLTGHGFVFSALTMVDDEVSLDDLDAELARLVQRALQP